MKLWEKGTATKESIERFTVGRDREFDQLLASHDIMASIAHAIMLSEVGILSSEEAAALTRELRALHEDVMQQRFEISVDAEDVHSYVEQVLTERLGDIGKKIHTGRSRNDQVLVDLKLYLRSELTALHASSMHLFDVLLELAEKHKDALLPGYTHFQIAMPSSFGLWFSAYAESLMDDAESLIAAFNVVNKNPLGSAAGYGSSFALNRQRTTELLGFASLNVSSVYAQMTRGKSERVSATAIAAIASTLSKMAYDICLYSSQNFAFVSLATEYTTGSSIMPHKNNPDVFELIRAKCNRLQALPMDISMIINNLPSGYHRDFQILKELIFPAFSEIRDCLDLFTDAVAQLRIQTEILTDPKYLYLYSVDAVNALVQQGMSFRDAYKSIALQIKNNTFAAPQQLQHTHEGSLGNLRLDLIAKHKAELQSRIDTQSYQQAEQALLAS